MSTSLYSNIIQNVYNFSGNSACDAGTSTCAEGYSLYFPCLKDITRGQNVCFEFYVADQSTQDVADLRDVDAITLELSGLYGCTYGTYSYPDDIESLQTEEYTLLYSNDFGPRTLCHLTVDAVDRNNDSAIINTKESDFYSGTTISVSAYDTPTHIFIGWAILQDNEGCTEDSWDDYMVSKDNEFSFVINEDMTLYAIYRARKEYGIYMDPDNVNSHYNVTYDNIKYYLIHKPDEKCSDGEVHLDKVLEGYHMIAECVPNISTYDENSDSEDDYTYRFRKWKDGSTDRCRVFHIGYDTSSFEKNGNILLKAICTGPVKTYELTYDTSILSDVFDEEGIHINTEFTDNAEYEYIGDEYTKDIDNISILYEEEEGFLHFNDGTLVLSSFDVEEGIRIDIQAESIGDCDITVSVNGSEAVHTISGDEFNLYSFLFRTCDSQNITIKSSGECLVDKIEIYKETIIDKGKAKFCLDADETSKLPTGPLSVSGAVMVNGSTYGLAKAQIGTVNRLSKITLV